ncbi:MAG: DUF4091 domain-containing protein [Victivallales bacterium]|nr:DUF4091 domain-containing protein [Victivallales bacterium]
MNRTILCLALATAALASAATPQLKFTESAITLANGNVEVALPSKRSYTTTFRDVGGSGLSMLNSIVWYYGRNENEADHFYRDQSEEDWPVIARNHWRENNTLTLQLVSQNKEFQLWRTLRMYDDCEAFYLRHELIARQSREYPQVSFPLMRFSSLFDSVSYPTDAEMNAWVTEQRPAPDKIARAQTVVLHCREKNRSLLVMFNLNAPLALGFPAGLAVTYGDIKWAKTLRLKSLSYAGVNIRKAGDKDAAECWFAMLEGGALTEAHQAKARALATRFGVRAPEYRLRGLGELQDTPSSLAGVLTDSPELVVWHETSAKRVYPHTIRPFRKVSAIQLEAARCEFESAQLVLSPKVGMSLASVTVADLTGKSGVIPAANLQVQWLEYHRKASALSAFGMSEQIPDALLPIAPRRLSANQVLWLTVQVPQETAPGDYEGIVEVSCTTDDGRPVKCVIPLRLKVWPAILPKHPAFTFYGLLWSTPWELRRATADLASAYRMSVNVFPGGNAQARANFDGVKLNMPEAFDLSEHAVKVGHANVQAIPYLFMGAWNYKPGAKVHFLGLDPQADDFELTITAYLRACYGEYQARGIAANTIAYLWDEVTTPHYPLLRSTSALCHRVAPQCRVLTVGAPDEAVIAASDIIVTSNPCNWWGELAERRLAEGRLRGKEFWVYANGTTFSLDEPLTRTRLTPWRCWGFGLTGYLQWTCDINWANGSFQKDGLTWLFHPAQGNAPVSSMRLAAMRDGIDDFDLLTLARAALPPERWTALEKELGDLVVPGAPVSLSPEKILLARGRLLRALSGQ